MFLANEEEINLPQCVKEAISQYREDTDWLASWLNDICDTGANTKFEPAMSLYNSYSNFCKDNSERPKERRQFYKALETKGFLKKRTSQGMAFYGISLKTGSIPAYYEEFDFLN